MTETPSRPVSRSGSPQRILLATDLSCRCDRAQDRAALLAERWGARLIVLHVLEGSEPDDLPSWRRGPSAEAQVAERQIRADMQGRSVDWEVVLDRGEPAEAILRQATERDCGLVVTGVARDETLGPVVLGTAVDWLVRRAPMPVLVVKGRPRRPYAALVAATDFSEPSRHALEAGMGLFPEASITLFHAYRVPFEGFIGRGANRDELHELAAAECAAFMAQVRSPAAGAGQRLRTLLEYGSPDELIAAYVRDNAVDLVVLGTHGRSGLSGFLVGSTAERLLSLLPCDVLIVRGPTPPPVAAQEAAG